MVSVLEFIRDYVIDLLIWLIIISAILSWLVAFNVINTGNQFVRSVWEGLYKLTEPMLRPIRKILPDLGGIDISPVILILILFFIQKVVITDTLIPMLS